MLNNRSLGQALISGAGAILISALFVISAVGPAAVRANVAGQAAGVEFVGDSPVL